MTTKGPPEVKLAQLINSEADADANVTVTLLLDGEVAPRIKWDADGERDEACRVEQLVLRDADQCTALRCHFLCPQRCDTTKWATTCVKDVNPINTMASFPSKPPSVPARRELH